MSREIYLVTVSVIGKDTNKSVTLWPRIVSLLCGFGIQFAT